MTPGFSTSGHLNHERVNMCVCVSDLFSFCFMYTNECFISMHVCTLHVCSAGEGHQIEPLELEFHIVVDHHVGARTEPGSPGRAAHTLGH